MLEVIVSGDKANGFKPIGKVDCGKGLLVV